MEGLFKKLALSDDRKQLNQNINNIIPYWDVDKELKRVETQHITAPTPTTERMLRDLTHAQNVPMEVPRIFTALAPFQRYAIYHMINRERHGYCAIYSDPVGTGKTFVCLAVHALAPIPPNRWYIDIIDFKDNIWTGLLKKQFSIKQNVLTQIKSDAIRNTTVAVVKTAVYEQWIQTLDTYTDFSYCAISTFNELIKFAQAWPNVKPDIIVLKNTNMTSVNMAQYFGLHGSVNSLDLFNLITKGVFWARVFYDDFLPLDYRYVHIPACYSWVVSSTRTDATSSLSNWRKTRDGRLQTGLLHIYSDYSKFDDVQNSKQFIDTYNKLPHPVYKAVYIKTVTGFFTALISELEHNSDVTDALKADSVATAAKALDIKVTSPGKIFQKVLGDNYQAYLHIQKVIKFTESLDMNLLTYNRTYKYTRRDLRKLTAPEFQNDTMADMIEESLGIFRNEESNLLTSIKRVIDKLKENECPICGCEIEEDITIMKHCGVAMCASCLYGFLAEKYPHATDTTKWPCPGCRVTTNVGDILIIPQDLNLDKLLECKYDEINVADEEPSENLERITSKLDAIKHLIIYGDIKDAVITEEFDRDIQHGSEIILPDAKVRKVLVFTDYVESIDQSLIKLNDTRFQTFVLGGTSKKIAETAREFNRCATKCVLVINSAKHCAGLNLQTATHIVFLHRPKDSATRNQIIGRGQRLGRNSQLQVYTIKFASEK